MGLRPDTIQNLKRPKTGDAIPFRGYTEWSTSFLKLDQNQKKRTWTSYEGDNTETVQEYRLNPRRTRWPSWQRFVTWERPWYERVQHVDVLINTQLRCKPIERTLVLSDTHGFSVALNHTCHNWPCDVVMGKACAKRVVLSSSLVYHARVKISQLCDWLNGGLPGSYFSWLFYIFYNFLKVSF